ncbi:DUF1534 domain-containing protein [Pseudomonas syringae]|uniref:DUF1534 domain-containing protein n=1 Tax=Pseudomonas syringae TaxID=317 RepID=A0A6B2AQH3_PSESX|nr:DUF1534 domain-containing protein [Pseudomonas syringae]PYD13201.1 hypothetical protein DND62_12605 [Pseudomonas syringae pv. pisi]MCF5739769.1 DUF1534 domain-containing protein [Pseudomonas syringae]MCF5748042.1 DUF1534 domain-containing protein [Pseudomonas syringae]MCF5754843.1 DUF1534 domain-containing protein [Pseudomonas syringae]
MTPIVPHARCGNAFRDAPRHNSVPHCTFKSERGTSASYMHL